MAGAGPADAVRDALAPYEKRYHEALAVERVEPNPWNPNVMDEATEAATRRSLEKYGFLLPMVVRNVGSQRTPTWQIIDGEHRWALWQDLGGGTVPAIEVIGLADLDAEKLTVIFNDTRGEHDDVKLGQLLASWQDRGMEDLQDALRYSDGQLEHLLTLGRTDFEGFGNPHQEPPDPGDGTGALSLTIRFRDHNDKQYLLDAVDAMREETDGLPAGAADRYGHVVAVLACRYLDPEHGD